MNFREFLEGRWLGHPLHPALVHLPTGLWPAALIFDVLSLGYWSEPSLRAIRLSAFLCIAVGLLGALSAIPAGIAEWSQIKQERPAWRLALYHMMLNLGVAVLWAINLGLRIETPARNAPVAAVPLAVSVLATVLLGVSGYLGGRMVYNHGIGVARFSKKRWRRLAQAAGANVPAE